MPRRHETFPDVGESRRRNMAAIRGKDTKPELLLRQRLHAMGYRYRLHVRTLPGCPDLVFPARGAVVFVHGCFWHRHQGCRNAVLPRTRAAFWSAKLAANVERDRRAIEHLQLAGWRVRVAWECEIEANPHRAATDVADFLFHNDIVTIRTQV